MMVFGLFAGWLGQSALATEASYEPDPFVGLYMGMLTGDDGSTTPAQAFVYAQGAWLGRGRDVYQVRFEIAGTGEQAWDKALQLPATPQDSQLVFRKGEGSIDGKTVRYRLKSGAHFDLTREEIPSPTLGKKPPEGAVVLLPFEPGETPSLEAWDNPTWKALEDGSIVFGKGDIRTRKIFSGIARLHIEFMLPVEPGARGQSRGNSGIYVHDRYEVQVLDSFGLAPAKNTCGAIYGVAAPLENAARPAGQWQAYDIAVRHEKLGVELTVKLNGVQIQSWRRLTGPTGGGVKGTAFSGPLRLQEHGHPVRYRNIWLERALKAEKNH